MKMNLDRILPVIAPLLRRGLHSKQAARALQFKEIGLSRDRVVFLGDSITEWTAWEDWFPSLQTANRGIGGQAISDIAARLDTAINQPRAISLLIGTNDLHGLGKSTEVQDIADQMRALVEAIRSIVPEAPLFINSIFPRSGFFKKRILELNEHYREIADRNAATYVDLWPVLAGADGSIRDELTADGLHLSVAGYAAWVGLLRPLLAPFAV